MRGTSVLFATFLTLSYGFAAHAAISADRAETIRRVTAITSPGTPTAEEAASRVWYGGMLPPVVVEAAVEREVDKCYLA